MIALAMLAAIAMLSAAPPEAGKTQVQVESYVRTGGTLPAWLSPCDLATLPALEDFFLATHELSEQQYRQCVPRLAAEAWAVREETSRQLACAGPTLLPWLEEDLKRSADPEIRHRLAEVKDSLQTWPAKTDLLKKSLAAVYAAHTDELWKKRIDDAPAKEALEPRTILFCSALPLAELKPRLAKTGEDRRLEIILRLLYEHRPGEAAQLGNPGGGAGGYTAWTPDLSAFDVAKLLEACGKLWPVELESPVRDGAYFWTIRAAKAKDGLAENVIQISIDRSTSPAHIVHFHVFRECPFDRTKFGPFLAWMGDTRTGRDWRAPNPPALKYLPAAP